MCSSRPDRIAPLSQSIPITGGLAALTIAIVVGVPCLLWWQLKDPNFHIWLSLAVLSAWSIASASLIASLFHADDRAPRIRLLLPLSEAAVFAGILCAVNLSMGMKGAMFLFICTAVLAAAAVAGVFAGLVRQGRLRPWGPLLLIWLLPGAALGLYFLPRYDASHLGRLLTFALSVPFGPWATQVARLGHYPNAGEFFHLPLALALTVLFAATALVALRSTSNSTRALGVLTYAAVVVASSLIGVGQLLNCAS